MRDFDDRGTATKIGFRKLAVALTEDENVRYGERMGRMVGELGAVQDKKKTTTAELGSHEKLLQSQISDLGMVLREGEELRDVECNEVFDYDKGECRIYRNDSGHLVDTRPLTREERQTRMF